MNQPMEAWRLKQLQSISLRSKIARTERKIKEWYEHWEGAVYVSISGRDSAVLLDLVRGLFPRVVGVYCDTGQEYPEVRSYIKALDNIVWLKPKLTYKEIVAKYGYPVASKETSQKIYECRRTKSAKLRHKRLHGDDNKYRSGRIPSKWLFLLDAPFPVSHICCDILKKRPAKKYEKESGNKPMVGTMVGDSKFRRQSYLKYSCNAFELGRPRSAPLSIWTHQDIVDYVEQFNIVVPSCYPEVDHTGCMDCMFGVHLEPEPNRFQRMEKTRPNRWKYSMDKLGLREVLEYIGVPYSHCRPTESTERDL